MSLSKALLRLREEASRLNNIADEATRALHVVEQFLRRSNVGIPMSVSIGNGWHLAYCKYHDSFALLLDDNPDDERSTVLLWQQAPRELKISAAAHLQVLVEKILAELQRQTSVALDEDTVVEIARIGKAIDQFEEGDRNAQ